MLTLLLALSAQAADFPVATAYEVAYEDLQIVPADIKKHEAPKLDKANITPPRQLGWEDMPDGLNDLANGLAWWLKAPSLAAAEPGFSIAAHLEKLANAPQRKLDLNQVRSNQS